MWSIGMHIYNVLKWTQFISRDSQHEHTCNWIENVEFVCQTWSIGMLIKGSWITLKNFLAFFKLPFPLSWNSWSWSFRCCSVHAVTVDRLSFVSCIWIAKMVHHIHGKRPIFNNVYSNVSIHVYFLVILCYNLNDIFLHYHLLLKSPSLCRWTHSPQTGKGECSSLQGKYKE